MTSTLAEHPGVPGEDEAGEAAQAQSKGLSIKKITKRTRGLYRADIDGIRGIAAIMVMGFHAGVPGFGGGFIGLDLFFVVSGYVITNLLMGEFEKTGGIKWSAFYARRARRLIPAKATMLIVVLVLSYFITAPIGPQQETAKSAAAAAAFVSNFFFLHAQDTNQVNYFAHTPGTGVLIHTWSLAVEEQFYLAVPLALLLAWLLAKLVRRSALKVLLFVTLGLIAGSCWWAIAWSGPHPDAAYYLPTTRAFEFLIGVALALIARLVVLAEDLREVLGLLGALLIAYCIVRPLPVDGYPSFWALIPCVAAMLLVWAGVDGPTVVTKFLSFRAFVALGLVSYGWYLWHWPLLVLGEAYNKGTPPLWARVTLVMVGLGIAALSYRFIEGLFYKRSGTVKKGTTWGSRRVVVTGVLAMGCVAGLAFAGNAVADAREGSSHWQQAADALDDTPVLPASCLNGEVIPTTPGRCDIVPFEKGRPTMVLWGDSHAWMYLPALQLAAEKRHTNLVAFTMGTCPPFYAAGDTGSCAKSNREALAYVSHMVHTHQPVRAILSASWETYLDRDPTLLPAAMDPQYREQISSFFNKGAPPLFEQLGKLDIPIDTVGPTPIIPRNAPLCTAQTDIQFYSCNQPRGAAIVHEGETLDFLQSMMSALPRHSRLIDVTQALCNPSTCFAESNGTVNYFDNNHLSATAAREMKRYFMPSFRALAKSAGPETGAPGRSQSTGDSTSHTTA